jgi:methylated-DNA-[protein]-cysteine S-methyltransferase
MADSLSPAMDAERLQGITPFQRKVYRAVSEIPKGRVMTYQGLARAIGCASCQAVGQALKRNPFAPSVPCHRVIKSDLTIGGYAGANDGDSVRRKLALLAEEGVLFVNGRLLDPARVFIPSP